jgi:carboxyl-terminal processing protease
MKFLPVCAVVLSCALVTGADLTPEQRQLNVESFEYAWKAIRDHMWEPMPAHLDWQQVHDELKPKVQSAATMNEARAVMNDMIARLRLTHFGIVPADVYEKLGHALKPGSGKPGEPGFQLRLIDGNPVVRWIETDSPAYAAGVRNGWRLAKVGGIETAGLTAKLMKSLPDTTVRELQVTRALQSRFEGAVGDTIPAEFLDAKDTLSKIDIELKAPRGLPSKLGYLATQQVWFESRRIDQAGYIRFNMFLDPARIAPQFGDAVESCKDCRGIVIDLRGNPGGIGGMSMGMAGWFVSKPDQRLGVMKMKGTELKFAVIPRAQTFEGPLAILVDGLTGSTSEIFAGGLKDLGRARIFGTRTAGAALPSVFEKLPNGDGFQYAISNYVSKGGKPLEGIGVIPDREVRTTRKALLDGRDPALDAALEWIAKETEKP